MNDAEQGIIERNIRRTVGVSALRKISTIVVEEQQADAEKAYALRWFVRFGLVVMLCVALLFAYAMGLI
jgi:hypothetical protein